MRPRLLIALALLWLAPPAQAELRRIESEGAVAVVEGSTPSATARNGAQHDALVRAVVEAGLELLGEDRTDVGNPPAGAPIPSPTAAPPSARSPAEAQRQARVRAAVEASPLDFAARFRVIQDIGPRPRSLLDDPAVAWEYAVRVEAHVDLDRLRRKLSSAGIEGPASAALPLQRHVVRLSGLGSLAQYAQLRRLLASRLGAKGTTLVEASPGRIWVALDAPGDAGEVRRRLVGVTADGIRLEPDPNADGEIALRVVAAPTAPAAGSTPGAPNPSPPLRSSDRVDGL